MSLPPSNRAIRRLMISTAALARRRSWLARGRLARFWINPLASLLYGVAVAAFRRRSMWDSSRWGSTTSCFRRLRAFLWWDYPRDWPL